MEFLIQGIKFQIDLFITGKDPTNYMLRYCPWGSFIVAQKSTRSPNVSAAYSHHFAKVGIFSLFSKCPISNYHIGNVK